MHMSVSALHHYTLRCAASELGALNAFYTQVLGLEPGRRPAIPAPGTWLYAGGQPIVHLYAYLDTPDAAPPSPVTGPLDHISFRAQGLEKTRRHLRAHGIEFAEAPIPDWPIHQLFLHDPNGVKVEINVRSGARHE